MLDRQDKIENAVCLAIIAVITLVAVSLQLRADDSDYWRARVATALVIQEAESGTTAATAATVTKPQATEKPVVKMYTATWCGPCQRAKADFKHADLPFVVEYIDCSNGGQPKWCNGMVPGFGWQVNGETRYIVGYPGLKQLIERWERTFKPMAHSRSPPGNGYPSFSGYQPNWTWPGDLRQHLQSTHGVGESATLTQDQAERLHDALHSGLSLQQIRSHYRR